MLRNLRSHFLLTLYQLVFGNNHRMQNAFSGNPLNGSKNGRESPNSTKKLKLRDLSPRANYTDRGAAAGRRS